MYKKVEKTIEIEGWDPHDEIRLEILCRMPVRMSKTEGWRPIW